MLACSSAAVDGDLSEISPQTFGAKYNDCAGSWQKVNDLSSDFLLTGRCTRVNTRVGQMTDTQNCHIDTAHRLYACSASRGKNMNLKSVSRLCREKHTKNRKDSCC